MDLYPCRRSSLARRLGLIKGCSCRGSYCGSLQQTLSPVEGLDLTDSKKRKDTPLWSGVLQYFPLTLQAIARVSKAGNDKHNPGEPLHWERGKSMDQEDCILRHMVNPYEPDPDTGELHIVHAAWRALAAAEIALEQEHDYGRPGGIGGGS